MAFTDDIGAVVLHVSTLEYVRKLAKVESMPTVLCCYQAFYQDADQRAKEYELMNAELNEKGILRGDTIQPTLLAWLRALDHPDRELAGRVIRDDTMLRMALVRADDQHALAIRYGDEVVIQNFEYDPDKTATQLAQPALTVLGPGLITEFERLSAPLQTIKEAKPQKSNELEPVFSSFLKMGASQKDAKTLAGIVSSATVLCEFVAQERGDGTRHRTKGAVSIFDSPKGRLVSSPTLAGDGEVWSTFTPGTDHRISQAFASLIELLPSEKWWPENDHSKSTAF